MSKMKKSNSHIANTIAIALVLSTVIIAVTPVTATDVSVIRDLPDDPVYSGDEIEVSLNQSGFYLDMGTVTEQLPEGFKCRGLSLSSGGEIQDYDETTNSLTIGFRMETTVTYIVETGTAEQIETAVFSGTWKTFDAKLSDISGDIEGDDTLTLGVGPKPTPTPGNGNGGNGGNGGVTPTPTPTATATVTPGETPSPSPAAGATATPTWSPTASPGTTETPTATPGPTKEPLIPGFGAVFVIASLLSVTYLLLRKERKA